MWFTLPARQLRPHDHQSRGNGPNDGKQRILDIQPGKLYERVSVILGSKNEVERVTSYHAK